MNVEPLAVGIAALIAIRGGHEQQHRAAVPAPSGRELDVPHHISRDRRTGRFVTKQLFDGVRNQCRILHELGALLGMIAQHLASPADQSRGSLIAGAGEHVDEDENLLASEFALLACLIHELGLQQLGHEVVGWMLGAPIDVLLEALARIAGLRDVHRLAGLSAQCRIDFLAYRFLVLFGNAEQHADDAHRHLRAEIRDEVEAAGADERIETSHAVGANLVFQRRSFVSA